MLKKSDYNFYKADAKAEVHPAGSALFGLVFKIDKKSKIILDCNFYEENLAEIKPFAQKFCLNLIGQDFVNLKFSSPKKGEEICYLAYQKSQENYTMITMQNFASVK
jgi:hypothetical protein